MAPSWKLSLCDVTEGPIDTYVSVNTWKNLLPLTFILIDSAHIETWVYQTLRHFSAQRPYGSGMAKEKSAFLLFSR